MERKVKEEEGKEKKGYMQNKGKGKVMGNSRKEEKGEKER
jgi:hypothetical protein